MTSHMERSGAVFHRISGGIAVVGDKTSRTVAPLQVQAGTGKVLLQEEWQLDGGASSTCNGCIRVGSCW